MGGTGKSTLGEVDLGTLTWRWTASVNIFYATVADMKAPTTVSERLTGIMSSAYPVSSTAMLDASMTDHSMLRLSNIIYIKDTSYSSPADFKTAMNGVQLVYELDTPTDLTFTPQSITLNEGTNNVWSENGDVELTYRRSLKMAVEALEDRTVYPDPPTSDGAYRLKATVSDGATVYSWEPEE